MSRDRRLLKLAFAAIGFTATISQLALLRELVAAFYGNELLIGAILAVWMAWTAAGAGGLGRLAIARSAQTRRRMFAAGLALLGVLLPATLALARGSRSLLALTPGVLVGLGPTLIAVVVVLAPFCLVAGALFTLGVRLAADAHAGAGRAYAWESAGAVAGGVLFSFALIRWLDPLQIALLVAVVDWAVALAVLTYLRATPHRDPSTVIARSAARDEAILVAEQEIASSGCRPPRNDGGVTARRRLLPPSAPLLLLLLAPLALLLGHALNLATLRWQWPHLVFAGDSPYGRITVAALGNERVFYTDGLLAFETQGVAAEEVAHFPLLAHPDPRRVLLIGGGVAGDLREILKHPVDAVTYIELDPLLLEAARNYLPEADAAILGDPRARVVMTDGRRYVNTTDERFDVVILDLPEPITGALNRFYTTEFFTEARDILAPGGILALHLPSAENYWSPELTRRNASIYRTLETAFPHILTLPGERNFFLASEAPITTAPNMLAERLAGREIQTRWVTPAYLSYILTTDRFLQVRQTLEAAGNLRLNRDLAPISYYYGQALWASMLSPGLRAALDQVSLISLWWLAIPFILAAALARWRRTWATPFAVACAGLAGMLFALVISFAFQVQHGSLYAEVGLIVAAYMGGLALGASAANRLRQVSLRGGRQPLGPTEARGLAHEAIPAMCEGSLRAAALAMAQKKPSLKAANRVCRTALLIDLGLTTVFAGVLPLALTSARSLPAPAFWLMALIAGCLGGMTYPLAIRIASPEPSEGQRFSELSARGTSAMVVSPIEQNPPEEARRTAAAGRLYGADLLGGCLGALLGAAFLVPVLGIPQTCVVIALAALAGLIALV